MTYLKDEEWEERGYTQYWADSIRLKAGDFVLINNTSCISTFAATIEEGGASANFKLEKDTIRVLKDGLYQFYFKNKMGADLMYINQLFDTEYFLTGEFNKWKREKMTALNKDSLTFDIDLEESETYEFKIVKGHGADSVWYGIQIDEGYEEYYIPMTYNNCKAWELAAGGNKNIKMVTTQEDSYKFILDIRKEPVELSIVMPEPVKETIYFINAFEWETPKVHLWGGSADATEWPGIEMKKLDDPINGFDVYELVADKGAFANCIFNDGKKEGAKQTADLDWTAGKYFYVDAWYAEDEIPALPSTTAKYSVGGDCIALFYDPWQPRHPWGYTDMSRIDDSWVYKWDNYEEEAILVFRHLPSNGTEPVIFQHSA